MTASSETTSAAPTAPTPPTGTDAIVDMYPFKAVLPGPLYWLFRGVRTLITAICFACFWLGCILVGWVTLPYILLVPGTRAQKLHRGQRIMRAGFRFFHFWMRVVRSYHRTSALTTLRPSPDQPVVIVANHPSLCDITSLASLFPNIIAVARNTIANHPLLHRVVRIAGLVPVGMHMMQECEERLRMGFDVVIFPEGTRSPMGGLHPFHRGAFEIALRAKVPIVMLKLTCSPPALTKRFPIWKHPDRMPILRIEPIDTIFPSDTELNSRELARTIEQRYRELLGYPAAVGAAVEPQPLGDGP